MIEVISENWLSIEFNTIHVLGYLAFRHRQTKYGLTARPSIG